MKFFIFSVLMSAFLIWKVNDLNPLWLDLSQNNVITAELGHPFDNFQPILLEEIDGEQKPTYQYRNNLERTGVSREGIALPMRTVWSSRKINYFIHGASKASAAADKDGVAVPSDSGWLYYFDFSGQLKWKFYISESHRGMHSTPILTKDYVYFGGYNGNFYAVHRKNGKPAWVTEVGQTIGASPIKDGRWIYVSVELTQSPLDGYIVKIDASNGNVKWKSDPMEEQSHSSPTIDKRLGLVIAGANSSKLFGMDIHTGEQRWSYETKGDIKGTAALVDGKLYYADWGGTLTALHSVNARHIWTTNVGDLTQSSPTVIKDIGVIVLSSNERKVLGISLDTGKVIWEVPTNSARDMGSATAFQETKTGQWMVATSCSATELCIMVAKTGEVKQRLDTGGKITSVPTVSNNRIYITTDDNNLRVFSGS